MAEQTSHLKFANVQIPVGRVFYQRQHVFAMVVHNQILPGHIVLCLRQPEVRFADISVHQLFDLTLAIKDLTMVLHGRFTNIRISTTTIIKDFDRNAIQNQDAAVVSGEEPIILPQLHVHLIPRQANYNMSNEQLDVMVNNFGTTFLHRQASNEADVSKMAADYRTVLTELGIDLE